jgi:putative ABC transport system permease protein
VDAIRTECPSVAYAAAGVRSTGQVVAGENNWFTQIWGTDVDWPFIRAWNVEKGVFFNEAEVKAGTKVAVLGQSVVAQLFPDSDPIDAVIRIKNVPFRVIGVLERKGGNTMGQDQDDQVVVPYTTLMKRLSGGTRLGMVQVAARAPDLIDPSMQEMRVLLRQRHRLQPGQDDDFNMRSQEEIAATAGETTRTFAILLASVAAISLLVGGIGIMNIMLVSVTERTREIGLRMAIGATNVDVLSQFLVESVVLSGIGGLLGIAIGGAGAIAVSHFAHWPVIVSPQAIAVAVLFSCAVGVVFGFYPALRASQLDPIDALRYE